MIIESSSSDEDEPMPSTSKYGLAPDKEFESRLSNSCRCLVKKYNDLIDVQKKLCDDYLDTKFRESMHEADLIDDTTHRLEDEIKSMRDVIYDPYKPILSSLPPDSDSDSDFIIIEEIIDEDSESDKIKDDKLEKREKGKSEKKKDYELDKNKEDEETNKLHKIDNNKNEVTDKDKQNKIVVPKENKEDEIDKDVIAINRTICAIPSDLPKEGTLEYPPLQIGQTVFATNLSTMLPWSEAILSTKENENLVNVYVDGKLNIIPIRSIAYVTPSPVQFPVGTRVLAKIDHNFKKIDYFYAGIIAEPPKLLNKFR
jgi:histone-lysine N-methyltransferase SETDB1